MKKSIKIFIVILVLLFAWFIWPTPYRNFLIKDQLPARENRFTHEIEYYDDGEWKKWKW